MHKDTKALPSSEWIKKYDNQIITKRQLGDDTNLNNNGRNELIPFNPSLLLPPVVYTQDNIMN